MGFFKKKFMIKVLYRGLWFYASSVSIDKDGLLDIEYCHNLDGAVDNEYVDEIKVEEVKND